MFYLKSNCVFNDSWSFAPICKDIIWKMEKRPIMKVISLKRWFHTKTPTSIDTVWISLRSPQTLCTLTCGVGMIDILSERNRSPFQIDVSNQDQKWYRFRDPQDDWKIQLYWSVTWWYPRVLAKREIVTSLHGPVGFKFLVCSERVGWILIPAWHRAS